MDRMYIAMALFVMGILIIGNLERSTPPQPLDAVIVIGGGPSDFSALPIDLKGTRDDSRATDEGVDDIVSANNRFAVDLYRQLRKNDENGNLFFSPYSISVALTIAFEGARGNTAEEMRSVLHTPKNEDIRQPNHARLYNELNAKDRNLTLSTANALWMHEDYSFLGKYISTIQTYYGAGLAELDFFNENEESRQIINSWVENETNSKIKELIPRDQLDKLTKLLITNAIYFQGNWVTQFDPEDTRNGIFTTLTGEKVAIPMMRLEGEVTFNYTRTNTAEILEMPYDGEDLSMLIILPHDDNPSTLEASLTADNISTWRGQMHERDIDVVLPKFKLETEYKLNDAMEEMGMPTAFSNKADFSGMGGAKNLKISSVRHKAFIEVNEKGTEAAAATYFEVIFVSVPPMFVVDHSFIFVIQHQETGIILFMGLMGDPSE